jgi:cytochrome P450
VEMIHGAKAGKLARGPFYQGDASRPADSLISTPDLYEHEWRRKIWERGFGTRQLKQYEPRVINHLDTLVSQLRKRAGRKFAVKLLQLWFSDARLIEVVDFIQWGEFFAYDVMSDLGFSEDFGMLEEGKPHRYVTALHGNARSLFIAGQTPWIRQLMWLFPLDAKTKQAGADFNKITRATYERRKARQDVKPDMFETISGKAATIGPRPLTEAEIVADASCKS